MDDAGIAIVESSNVSVYHNSVKRAGYGLRVTMTSTYNEAYENTFDDISRGEEGLWLFKPSSSYTFPEHFLSRIWDTTA